MRLMPYLDLVRWDRPAGWLLLLWPSLSALWVAAEGWPGWDLLLVFVLFEFLLILQDHYLIWIHLYYLFHNFHYQL